MPIKTLHLTFTDHNINDEFFDYFPNVTNLTIDRAKNLSNISLPTKLTNLTITGLNYGAHLPIISDNKVKHLNVHGCCTYANIETYTSLETLTMRSAIVTVHPKLRELSLKSLKITADTLCVYDIRDLLRTDELILNIYNYNNRVRNKGLSNDERLLLLSFAGTKHIQIGSFTPWKIDKCIGFFSPPQ